jgi:hypothetical protein
LTAIESNQTKKPNPKNPLCSHFQSDFLSGQTTVMMERTSTHNITPTFLLCEISHKCEIKKIKLGSTFLDFWKNQSPFLGNFFPLHLDIGFQFGGIFFLITFL